MSKSKINVLSLFDGISCAKTALENLAISNNYYRSEIDKYANQISQYHYPNSINLGDVTLIKKLPVQMDLVIGGSPCTSLSSAAGSKNSGLTHGQSTLFWEFIRVLKLAKPKYFVLENVASMKSTDKNQISQEINKYDKSAYCIEINSALLTAQNRKRLYWTNIPGIQQPTDRKVYLENILESGVTDRNKSYCLDANYYKGTNLELYLKRHARQVVIQPPNYRDKPVRICLVADKNCQGYKIYDARCKSITLSSSSGGPGRNTGLYHTRDCVVRKLTVKECCRLQGLPDDYCDVKGISKTQQYKALGNGFTVPVIEHILKNASF